MIIRTHFDSEKLITFYYVFFIGRIQKHTTVLVPVVQIIKLRRIDASRSTKDRIW